MRSAAPGALARLSTRARGAVAIAMITGFVAAGLVVVPPTDALAEPMGDLESFLVSRTDTGESTQSTITPDGQRVAFRSSASDLVSGDDNGTADVFLATAVEGAADPFAGEPILVSAPDGSLPQRAADGPSSHPVPSADGRYVAFLSSATNLAPGAASPAGSVDVYVRDTVRGTTQRLTGGSGATPALATSVDMSDDGRYVVFVSDAATVTPGDGNGRPDGFIADMDADGDGRHGDVTITRVMPDRSIPAGVTALVISGNGAHLAFTTPEALPDSEGAGAADHLYRGKRADAGAGATRVATGAQSPAIDGTGEVIVYVARTGCNARPAIIASTLDGGQTYYVGVGTGRVDYRLGMVTAPAVSADGSTVMWETTQPAIVFSGAVVLPEPVVRRAQPDWGSAATGVQCGAPTAGDWVDVGVGHAPSLSASGRTVAYSAAVPLSAASASVVAVDTHTHAGLAVATTQGQLSNVGNISVVDIARLPVSELQGYASTLADAPIYRLPIYRLPIYRLPIYRLPIYRLLVEDSPIYRLPIYRLPIYRLPIYRLDIPGGWQELLADTPFRGELPQSVTLADVLTWANAAAAPGSTATAVERAAATRIQSLTLEDVALDDSGIDSLSLASMVLGAAPLAQVAIAGTGTPTERWQRAVDEQGLVATIDDETVLAEMDAAGLDIGRSGVETAVLRDLPLNDTLLDTITVRSLFLAGTPLGDLDVATLTPAAQSALFAGATTGTLAQNHPALLPDATVADLAAGAPADLTLGTLLFSLLDTASYPWEQIAPASIDPGAAVAASPGYGCDGQKRCGISAQFTFTFDPGPGERTAFAAPTASISLPAGTAPSGQYTVNASGPSQGLDRVPYTGPVQVDGNLVRLALGDAAGGTSFEFEVGYTTSTQPGESSATATLTSGNLTGSAQMDAYFTSSLLDDPAHNRQDGDWVLPAPPGGREPLREGHLYYEWISPGPGIATDTGVLRGPALDEDYFLIEPPAAGERLIVSTNAADGEIALALFSDSTAAAPLGVASAGAVPGTVVTEQTGSALDPAEAGGDAAAPLADHTLVDQAVVGGDGSAQVEAAAAGSPSASMLLRVTSGNGNPGSSLYSLRVRYIDEPPEQMCTPWTAPQTADPGVIGASDPVTATTNTVYVFDQQRFGDTHGAAAATAVRTALATLDGTGRVGAGAVDGAVLSVDDSPAVRSARAALDANPCSMAARRTMTAAVNDAVATKIAGVRAQISSVVIVGGDDILPLAPVAQQTAQFNEASHAASLRLPVAADGSTCPAAVPAGTIDPCTTPLSAAAAGSHILSDDPYGLATAYESLGGYLYVPTVGTGRLVDTPNQILATIERFVASDGVMAADTTYTGGYGAWAELPALVTENLAWRSSISTTLTEPWTKTDVESALFPAGGESPRVVSINTHADETRMLPGIPGADDGRFEDADLLLAAEHTESAQLAGSLVFMIGCHAGGNLPSGYYGAVTDWADVFASAGGFVGNTGFGLANNVTTALSERLLALYADWIGVEAGGAPVSAAAALAYAKQSYLGGLGLYSGYDEKVLMQTVYYGLPMYTFEGELKPLPLPEVPASLSPVQGMSGDLQSAGLSLSPSFQTKMTTDASGREIAYLVADGQEPLAVAGQPILPRVVAQLNPAPAGMAARGALITGLTSTRSPLVTPAIAQAGVGVPEAAAQRNAVAFPSRFATVTNQQTPNGPVDLLVVTPGRTQADAGGQGYLEQFTAMNIDIIYGPADSSDTVAPVIRSVELPTATGRFTVRTDGNTADIARMLLLIQSEGSDAWRPFEMTPTGNTWSAEIDTTDPVRWIIQAVDTAGNVAIESERGRMDTVGSALPTLTRPADAALVLGERLQRSVVVQGSAAGLAGSFALTGADGEVGGSGTVVIETGADGVTRALLDHVTTLPGEFTVELALCRGTECTTTSFVLEVAVTNTAPTAVVTLSGDAATVVPTSLLTASATGADQDDDPVALSYAWAVNGIPQPDTGATFEATTRTEPGDVVSVTVTPHDGRTAGHTASASLAIQEPTAPPAPPTITATAQAAGAAYAAGSWSPSAVTVSFTCVRGGAPILTCPAPVVISTDTGGTGVEVTATVTDLFGGTATSAPILVRVDRTAPTLAPVLFPPSARVGETIVAVPHATDAGSGVLEQSCDVPATTAAGSFRVECRARDVAGNAATSSVPYTVTSAPTPTPSVSPPPSASPTPTPTRTHPSPTATPKPKPTAGATPRPRPSASPVCGALPERSAAALVNADGSSVYLRTSGVPIAFSACDAAGNALGTPGYVTGVIQVSTAALPGTARINELWYPPLSRFVYSKQTNAWLGFIPTAQLAGGSRYTYRVELSDGTSFTVVFGVR